MREKLKNDKKRENFSKMRGRRDFEREKAFIKAFLEADQRINRKYEFL